MPLWEIILVIIAAACAAAWLIVSLPFIAGLRKRIMIWMNDTPKEKDKVKNDVKDNEEKDKVKNEEKDKVKG